MLRCTCVRSLSVLLAAPVLLLAACVESAVPRPAIQEGARAAATPTAEPVVARQADRLASIPGGAERVTPNLDPLPPVVWSAKWSAPVPLPAPVNSAGAEDSPFITPDGRTLLFFFTPDPSIPANLQVNDGVTGIWMSTATAEGWTDPVRPRLADTQALDGCGTLRGEVLWFCSARAGNVRGVDIWFARFVDGQASDWRNAGTQLNGPYEAGELDVFDGGGAIVFHSARPGGLGGLDLWVTRRDGDGWSEPENFGAPVNGPGDQFLPWISEDGADLWFTAPSSRGDPGPAIFRTHRVAGGEWSVPEEIVSRFAAEPTLDAAGNLYFAHHVMDAAGAIVDVEIYVTRPAP